MENYFDVSVILPIKSATAPFFEDYFKKCIESLNNQKLKINSVKLEPFKFIEGAHHLMLNCETEKIAGSKLYSMILEKVLSSQFITKIGVFIPLSRNKIPSSGYATPR